MPSSPDPVLQSSTYPVFRERLAASGCRLCGLSSGRTRIVVDRGNPNADIVLVGEAPGADEDREGAAFVGRSGRLLDELFLEQGIKTDTDTLILNVVKCRPPGNRPPSKEEAHACSIFFNKQFSFLKPDFVVLLGRTASGRILEQTRKGAFSAHAGKFYTSPSWPGIQILPLFHPAYLLRDPRKKIPMRRFIADLKHKRDHLRNS